MDEKRTVFLCLAFAGLAVCSHAAQSGDATIPGTVTAPFPTINNLAIEWKIDGDENLNGVVTVNYREVGEDDWRDAMPLRRVPAGQSRRTRPIFHWENKHSGSIFDLEPATEYEVALSLHDPDGGSAERSLRAHTRPVPTSPPDASVRRLTSTTTIFTRVRTTVSKRTSVFTTAESCGID